MKIEQGICASKEAQCDIEIKISVNLLFKYHIGCGSMHGISYHLNKKVFKDEH